MDLICTPMSQINLMVVMWFIMYGIGGILTFPIMDKIGRRKTSIIFNTGHIFAHTLIIFSSDFITRTIGFTLLGFFSATKNSVCYAWLFELVNQKDKSFANTCLNMGDYLVLLLAGLYFIFVSQDWAPLIMSIYFIDVAASLVILFLCSESPRWLLMQGRRQEAIQSLNFIAKVNGSTKKIAPETEFLESKSSKVTTDH